jgi:hypothetical protein
MFPIMRPRNKKSHRHPSKLGFGDGSFAFNHPDQL